MVEFSPKDYRVYYQIALQLLEGDVKRKTTQILREIKQAVDEVNKKIREGSETTSEQKRLLWIAERNDYKKLSKEIIAEEQKKKKEIIKSLDDQQKMRTKMHYWTKDLINKEIMAHNKAQTAMVRERYRIEREEAREIERRKRRYYDFFRYVQHWALRLGIFLSAGAVLRGIERLTIGVIDAARQIDQMSKITGFSTESLSGLNIAAKTFLITSEQLQRSLAYMNRSIELLGRNTPDQVWAFGELGIKYEKIKNLKPEEQLKMIAEAFKNIKEQSKQVNIATALFERSGREIIPIIQALGDDFNQFNRIAEETGGIFTERLTKAALEAGKNIESLKSSFNGLGIELSNSTIPALNIFVDTIKDLIRITSQSGLLGSNLLAIQELTKLRDYYEKHHKPGTGLYPFGQMYDIKGLELQLKMTKNKEKEAELIEKLILLYKKYKETAEGIEKGTLIYDPKTGQFIKKQSENVDDLGNAMDELYKSMAELETLYEKTKIGEYFGKVENFIDYMNKNEWGKDWKQKNLDRWAANFGFSEKTGKDKKKGKTENIPFDADEALNVFTQYEKMLNELNDYQRKVAEGMMDSFNWFFQQALMGAENFRDTLKGFFNSIKQSFLQMLAEMLAKAIATKLFGAILAIAAAPATGGASIPAWTIGSGPLAAGSFAKYGGIFEHSGRKRELPKFASGGYFTGYGHKEIPAILHPEEVVFNKRYIGDMGRFIAETIFKSGATSSPITNNHNMSYTPSIQVSIFSPDLNDPIQIDMVANKVGAAIERNMRKRAGR